MNAAEISVEGHAVHLPDVNGFHATVPSRVIHVLRETAKNSDDARAKWSLRWFHRDVLISAANLLDQADQCTFTTPAGDCDNAAVFDLANRRPRCDLHLMEQKR